MSNTRKIFVASNPLNWAPWKFVLDVGPTKKANGTDQDQERNSVVVRISTTLR